MAVATWVGLGWVGLVCGSTVLIYLITMATFFLWFGFFLGFFGF